MTNEPTDPTTTATIASTGRNGACTPDIFRPCSAPNCAKRTQRAHVRAHLLPGKGLAGDDARQGHHGKKRNEPKLRVDPTGELMNSDRERQKAARRMNPPLTCTYRSSCRQPRGLPRRPPVEARGYLARGSTTPRMITGERPTGPKDDGKDTINGPMPRKAATGRPWPFRPQLLQSPANRVRL